MILIDKYNYQLLINHSENEDDDENLNPKQLTSGNKNGLHDNNDLDRLSEHYFATLSKEYSRHYDFTFSPELHNIVKHLSINHL
jgi:hypothetical protein